MLLLVACAAARGGWEVAPVEARFPAVRAIPGQRLGDLTPYPAIEDGRVILEDACEDGAAPEGVVRSRVRQAKARAAQPASNANLALAREMLDAVESMAAPCPGTPGAPRICSLWQVTELYAG